MQPETRSRSRARFLPLASAPAALLDSSEDSLRSRDHGPIHHFPLHRDRRALRGFGRLPNAPCPTLFLCRRHKTFIHRAHLPWMDTEFRAEPEAPGTQGIAAHTFSIINS